jgi:hypothetical protein
MTTRLHTEPPSFVMIAGRHLESVKLMMTLEKDSGSFVKDKDNVE